jgi:hypothetical protein
MFISLRLDPINCRSIPNIRPMPYKSAIIQRVGTLEKTDSDSIPPLAIEQKRDIAPIRPGRTLANTSLRRKCE